jgi:ubiquinone biosynthesis accessory factor UbiJ
VPHILSRKGELVLVQSAARPGCNTSEQAYKHAACLLTRPQHVTAGFSTKSSCSQATSIRGTRRPHAYNPCMFHSLNSLVGTAAIERLTLLINHVLSSEPIAMQRLRPHAGRCIRLQFDGWPSLLPPLPSAAFVVTPAGLIEWCGEAGPSDPDLRVRIDASNPALGVAQALAGMRPKVDVAGDAAFATDLNWLIDNLRWDIHDDLAKIVGQAPAHEIARVAGGVAAGLREAAKALAGFVGRERDTPAGPPAR